MHHILGTDTHSEHQLISSYIYQQTQIHNTISRFVLFFSLHCATLFIETTDASGAEVVHTDRCGVSVGGPRSKQKGGSLHHWNRRPVFPCSAEASLRSYHLMNPRRRRLVRFRHSRQCNRHDFFLFFFGAGVWESGYSASRIAARFVPCIHS